MSTAPKKRAPSGPKTIKAWRLERDEFLSTWTEGIGAHTVGGRWNPPGFHVVYTSLDPSTPIIELAAHAGFKHLDRIRHTLIEIEITFPKKIRYVEASEVSNPNWLIPCEPTPSQQAFGLELLKSNPFVAIPSAVNASAWNLLIVPSLAAGLYQEVSRKRFALDARLLKSRP